ncbi:hypothetical protein VIGAN_04437400 [Vigna angularis var. angularis]|uniref:Uncharacterized protein n=1 Tax=Vigna angularis var. angularis TaxID=157739 RepID=A0A0S3S1H3_PHAAN|nr:hypothetical protein VIGAN_04437400 [Vigna angularis var. angularis]
MPKNASKTNVQMEDTMGAPTNVPSKLNQMKTNSKNLHFFAIHGWNKQRPNLKVETFLGSKQASFVLVQKW